MEEEFYYTSNFLGDDVNIFAVKPNDKPWS